MAALGGIFAGIIGVIIVLIIVLLIAVMTMYNGLVKARLNCEEAFSTMDVYMKKRFDLIPNLVETVKGYAKHEAETLIKVTAVRNAGHSSMDMQSMAENEKQAAGAIQQIFALSEQYPDLKANNNFQELMAQMRKIEEDIAQSRKYYNAVVKQYNTKIQSVPSNLIAGMFRFEKKEMFEVEDAAERKNVKISF